MNSRCLVAMLLTLLLAPHIAGAQARTLEPGNRIRVTLPVEKKAAFGRMNARRVGSLVEVTTDSLTILTETGTPLKLPLSGVERLDVSLGTTRMIQRGALTGGGVQRRARRNHCCRWYIRPLQRVPPGGVVPRLPVRRVTGGGVYGRISNGHVAGSSHRSACRNGHPSRQVG